LSGADQFGLPAMDRDEDWQRGVPRLNGPPAEGEGQHRRVRAGIQRLLSMQTSGGGLGHIGPARANESGGSAYGGHSAGPAKKRTIYQCREAWKPLDEYLAAGLRESHGAFDRGEETGESLSRALYALALGGESRACGSRRNDPTGKRIHRHRGTRAAGAGDRGEYGYRSLDQDLLDTWWGGVSCRTAGGCARGCGETACVVALPAIARKSMY